MKPRSESTIRAERAFNNRFRHGKCHFELARTNPADFGLAGARFEKTTLDEQIGPEIVVMLTDTTQPSADSTQLHGVFWIAFGRRRRLSKVVAKGGDDASVGQLREHGLWLVSLDARFRIEATQFRPRE
jgi:hypothetical protein